MSASKLLRVSNTTEFAAWLIIHRKGHIGQRLKTGLKNHLPSAVFGGVSFLHWGDHHGTNDFAQVENVILAGTLFLPEHTYEGRTRLSAGMCDDEEASQAQLKETKQGENTHAILQALCRASVRGLEPDGRCKPCRAYIIADPGSGIPKLLPELFPGCHVKEWQPIPEKLTSNVQRAIDEIDETFDEFCADVMTYKELCEDLGMDVKNFRRTVRRRASFQEALKERGLEETEVIVNGRTLKGVQRIPNPFPVEDGNNDKDMDNIEFPEGDL